jgi:glycosyltransferase involved in cell wall biosynthesis
MKIVFHSNAPWCGTGYGSQTGLFAPMFRDAGHDVALSAFWGLSGKMLEWEGMRLYPADDEWGNKWLPAYAAHHGAGNPLDVLVLTLLDVWVLTAPVLAQLHMASWLPVDHDPLPPIVSAAIKNIGTVPIAMSKFGEAKLIEAGFEPLYVPHGVDTSLMKPYDPRLVRAAMNEGMPEPLLPEDAFVVGMVAANKGTAPSRKAFPQAFEAFAELHRKHPDTLLYLHTAKQASGVGLDLLALADICGIPSNAIRFTPEFEIQCGVEYEKMAIVYSALDVLMNPAYGEGFGIPIVEAQACGAPVIVNDFSAMSELAGPGWKIGGEKFYDPSQGSWYQSPSVPQLVDALEESYDKASGLREDSRKFSLAYDTKTVMADYWTPVLKTLEESLLRPAVVPNRAMRRSAAKRQKVAA